MKKRNKLFLILAAAVVLAAIGAGAAIGMTNDYKTSEEYVVRKGGTIEIVLEENPSTGYSWIPVQKCEGKVEVLRDYYQEGDPVPGAPGKHVWVIKGMEKGTCELVFEYTRPWEENGSIDSKILKIRIK